MSLWHDGCDKDNASGGEKQLKNRFPLSIPVRKVLRAGCIVLLVSLIVASCSERKTDMDLLMSDEKLKTDLEIVAGKKIFFGHQSVGVDIMQGVKDLHQATTGSRLNLVPMGSGPLPSGSFFADALVGRNSDPNSKCDAFGEVVEKLNADSLDIALLKFCYVDIKDRTDVDEMFRYYVATIDTLKRKCPDVTLVHVTVPLTERTSAWKRLAKRVLGRVDVWEIAGIKRAAFNAQLVEYFKEEPIFDLARIESTYPDGSRCSFESDGSQVFSLVSDYTRDGGHLNELGRTVAARELLRMLAVTIKQGTP